MIKFLMALFFLFATTNAYASNASGGGPVFLSQMELTQGSIINPNTTTPNLADTINDDYIGKITLGITDFDTAKASAIFDVYNTDMLEKVQAYYQAGLNKEPITTDIIAFKAIEASVLSEYANFSQKDALDAVIFEPDFADSTFKKIIDLSM